MKGVTMISPGQSFAIPQIGSDGEQMHFLWVGAGSFVMGSPETEAMRSESERQFLATLSRGFWLSKNLITQAQWHRVMNTNPSKFQDSGAKRPVESVSWLEAMEYCHQLATSSHISLPRGYQFSLPTQTQWEYACRAGTASTYFFGDDEVFLDRFAWHSGNSCCETHPVGLKAPNPWGLDDVYGNVWEWCFDGPMKYPDSDATDWIGPADTEDRVVRGGSWRTTAGSGDFRSACRSYCEYRIRLPWLGFRVALRPRG